jgi:hypothetical protein
MLTLLRAILLSPTGYVPAEPDLSMDAPSEEDATAYAPITVVVES